MAKGPRKKQQLKARTQIGGGTRGGIISVSIRRFKSKRPLDPTVIRSVATDAQTEYARMVEDMYLDTVSDWEGATVNSASPRMTASDRRRTVNVYIRGDIRRVYLFLEKGFIRRLPIVPGYQPKTRPGVIGMGGGGSGGIVGRGRLKEPVQVEGRRFTETIAEQVRSGNVPLGRYAEFIRSRLRAHLRDVSGVQTTGQGQSPSQVSAARNAKPVKRKRYVNG